MSAVTDLRLRVALPVFLLWSSLTGAAQRQATPANSEPSPVQDNGANFADLRQAADRGEAEAQFNLGLAYAYGGLVIPPDYVQAAWWLRQAALQGFAPAQYSLGLLYYAPDGPGIPQNFEEAAFWFREAANQGDEIAQHRLAVAYRKGEGVPQNAAEALRRFRQAADQGFPDALHDLGTMYATGEGVERDDVEAYTLFTLAAHQEGYQGRSCHALDASSKKLTPQQQVEAQQRADRLVAGFTSQRGTGPARAERCSSPGGGSSQ